MAKQLQLRRGDTSGHSTFTGAAGEVTVDTDKNTVVVHDNATAGGFPLAQEGAEATRSHIIPGKLYPAVSGKLSDGSTSHSGAYGTAQSDGRMYYFTYIKGSKPIKDPRIGAHFGSQRIRASSIQLLEQETATHGEDVWSIDGREWARIVGSGGGSYPIRTYNDGQGLSIQLGRSTNAWVEIIGYLSDLNWIQYTGPNRKVEFDVDGGSTSTSDFGNATVGTPLSARFVNAGSVINLPLGVTLGIHTVRIITDGSDDTLVSGIELIAQDTTSTATKSQIQIPSQNVVSYGKKFTVAGTPHYNPFAQNQAGTAVAIANTTSHGSVATGWAGTGTGYFDNTLDTATSLGLSAWETGGDFYRPVNGGRIVKWVDETGTIKTSVNMMPPDAHAITDGVSSSTGTSDPIGTAWTTVYQPTFGNKRIGSNLVANGADWDNATGTTPPTGWATLNAATYTVADYSSGYGNAIKVEVNAANPEMYESLTGLTIGQTYKFQCQTKKGQGGGSTRIYLDRNDAYNGDLFAWQAGTTGWEWVVHTFVADVTTLFINLMFVGGGSGEYSLFDSVSLYEIEQPSSQAEVAKTYNWREFGNGAANGGTGATYADASMLSTADDIAYVMDDGLTSLSAVNMVSESIYIRTESTTSTLYITFIGTGLTIETEGATFGSSDDYDWIVDGITVKSWTTGNTPDKQQNVVQNLPYGTHIFQMTTVATPSTNHMRKVAFTFHQPKMPPIPEDAVVLADYMLMADFVKQTDAEATQISKGVRYCNGSRDHFYGAAAAGGTNVMVKSDASPFGITGGSSPSSGNTGIWKLPFFGTTGLSLVEQSHQSHSVTLGGSATTETALDNSVQNQGDIISIAETVTLGQTNIETNLITGSYHFFGHYIASPIHTSSHYQTFETPFLNELVGGDRNMEQTNLVVTPDGKTWDEVTRDVSYIGNMLVGTTHDNSYNGDTDVNIWDSWRGASSYFRSYHNKDFAIAYDRLICLVDGQYQVIVRIYEDSAGFVGELKVNGVEVSRSYNLDTSGSTHNSMQVQLKRGDYVQVIGRSLSYENYNFLTISRV